MDNHLFDRLTTSMQQMNVIAAGKLEPSRITKVTPLLAAAAPDNSPEHDANK